MSNPNPYPRSLLWLLCQLIFVGYTWAQDEIIPSRHYDRSNGLPAKKMYNMALDRDGFIWFAAENGIFRFDGKVFYPYTTKEGLCDNDIIEVFADRKGAIWCSGYNGKISVIENGVVNTHYPLVENWNSRGFIFDMAADPQGNLYMAGEEGEVFRIDSLHRVQRLKFDHALVALAFFHKPYVLHGHFISTWDFMTHRLRKELMMDTLQHFQSYHISRVDGSLWMHTDNGELQNLFTGKRLDVKFAGNSRVNFVSQVTPRYMVIGFLGMGPLLYDTYTGTHRPIKLPANVRVVDALQDRQGNVWLSAYRDGLFSFDLPAEDVARDRALSGFMGNTLGAFQFGNKTMALSSTDTLFVEGSEGTRRLPLHAAGKIFNLSENVSFAGASNSLMISNGKKLFIYNRDGLQEMPPKVCKAVLVYKDSLYFLRSSYRIIQQNFNNPLQETVVCAERAFSFCLQGDRLWIGVKDGLTYYDIRTQQKGPVVFRVPQDGRVEDIKPLGNHLLALATSNLGVLFIRNGRLLAPVNIAQGLFDDDCKELEPYPGGFVVRHPLGLSLIDFRTAQIRAISQWKNISVSSINDVYIYGGDTVLLSTSQGLLRTRLEELFEKIPERRAVKFLQVVSDGPPLMHGNIDLPYDQNKLKIDYALAEYDQPYQVQYVWRMNGGDWNKTTGSSLELADLSPGDYVLELRARAPGFDFSPVSTLRFHVRTPFWRTAWFLILLIVSLVGAIWAYLRQRYIRKLHTEREKASIRHQLMTFEQKALNAMMNPHFVFNAMGSIQHLLNTHQNQPANDYLVKFSRLIRKSLETSQQEFCYLDDEIERITLYLQLEKMRLGEKLVFNIEVEETLDPERIKVPTMILQTYVENAIIHGVAALRRGGAIYLSFRQHKDVLYTTLDDNGPGFNPNDKAKKNIRFGLSATEKRLELLTQITGKVYRVHVHSPLGPEGGTRVELFFPLE